jgi:hypothetical protein
MFSLQHMQRQFTAGRFDLLLKSVTHNGLQLPGELEEHLHLHPVCATALALRRALEVSYGRPDAQTGRMVAFLLEAQEADGSFGFAPLPTACGLVALGSILQDAPNGSLPAIRPQALAQAHAAASGALHAMITQQVADGLPRMRPDQAPLLMVSDAMDWAFVLLLLSEDTTWEHQQATEPLHRWFARHQQQLPIAITQLWRRTCWTSAPGSHPESHPESLPGRPPASAPTGNKAPHGMATDKALNDMPEATHGRLTATSQIVSSTQPSQMHGRGYTRHRAAFVTPKRS